MSRLGQKTTLTFPVLKPDNCKSDAARIRGTFPALQEPMALTCGHTNFPLSPSTDRDLTFSLILTVTRSIWPTTSKAALTTKASWNPIPTTRLVGFLLGTGSESSENSRRLFPEDRAK